MDDNWAVIELLVMAVRLVLAVPGRHTPATQAAAARALSALPAGSEVSWVDADGTFWTARTPAGGGQELTR